MKLIRTVSLLFMLLFSLTACGTMMILLGDNFRYLLTGQVFSSTTTPPKGIPIVEAAVHCPGVEKGIYQNRKGLTDENGKYELGGYWGLEDCKVTFTHADYEPLTLTIEKEHMLKTKRAFLLEYVVDVSLERKEK